MRLLINALSAKIGGGQTYLKHLLKNIPPDYDAEIFLLCGEFNKSVFSNYESGQIKFLVKSRLLKNPVIRNFWEFFCLPSLLKRLHIDCFFQPSADCYVRLSAGCRSVVMLRNMLPFDKKAQKLFPLFCLSRVKMFLQKHLVIAALRKFHSVIFISEYSRNLIRNYIPGIDSKSIVCPHGLDALFFTEQRDYDLSRFNLQCGQFYLYLSNPDYYKMQIELVNEWKILWNKGFRYPLVLVGSLKRKRYVRRLLNEIRRLNMEAGVIVTGSVPHGDIPALFHSARAILFASVCECCPNILLESMSSGKAVFCSSLPPMPEFAGNAPVYFNPYTPGELSTLILQMEKSPESMSEIGRKCRLRAECFPLENTNKKTFDYLRTV